MTSEQFTYWLQGFFEMTDTEKLTQKQTIMIKDHLKTVFNKVTPDYTGPIPPYPSSPFPSVPYSPATPDFIPPYTITCTDDPTSKLFCQSHSGAPLDTSISGSSTSQLIC